MKKTTTGTIAALAVAAVGTLILIAFRSVSVEAVYPLERGRVSFARRIGSRLSGLWHAAEARAENVRLKREVASLALVRRDMENLEVENARLRRVLDYRARRQETWQAAVVLSADGGAAGAHQTLRVDKGSLAGVREGAIVVVPEGLVGQVTRVTPHTSEVRLVTDPALKVSCEIEGTGGERPCGILSGGSEDALRLRHLRNAAAVLPRSRVLTSGLGGVFPKGIEIGTFLGLKRDGENPPDEGEVLPAVDYSTLEDVFIRREK